MVFEKTLESPLDCEEIQLVHSKGHQSWVFIGRNDAEAGTPILWPPHAKSWLIGKDPDVGRDWGQEEKGTTEDKMAGWHHRLDGHEFEWTLGVGDGQRGLACYDSWGCKESDMTEWLNWIELNSLFNSDGLLTLPLKFWDVISIVIHMQELVHLLTSKKTKEFYSCIYSFPLHQYLDAWESNQSKGPKNQHFPPHLTSLAFHPAANTSILSL